MVGVFVHCLFSCLCVFVFLFMSVIAKKRMVDGGDDEKVLLRE